MLKLLNVGCGELFHPDWINIDAQSPSPLVLAHDFSRGLPFEAASFDAVYHSHVLEHIAPDRVPAFLAELRRVLKPGAVMRVVVPDLENIARTYLKELDGVLERGAEEQSARYDWMMLELLDQSVRTRSGGRMAENLRALRTAPAGQREFIVSRIRYDAERVLNASSAPRRPLWQRVASKNLAWYYRAFAYRAARVALTLLGGGAFRRSFEEGVFRGSGEIHQWMYDRYSLKRLLERNGFEDVARVSAVESGIPAFASYELDAGKDGLTRKPDSLFMECRKPR